MEKSSLVKWSLKAKGNGFYKDEIVAVYKDAIVGIYKTFNSISKMRQYLLINGQKYFGAL